MSTGHGRDRREHWAETPWSQGRLLPTRDVERMSPSWQADAHARERRCAFAYFSGIDDGRSREFVYEYASAEECAAAVHAHNETLRKPAA